MDEVLRRGALFARLDDEAAAELHGAMSEVRYRRGQEIFAEGDPGDSLFVIASGRVKVVRSNAEGRETVLGVLGAGMLFGELAVIDAGERDASALALDDCVLLRLSGAEANRRLDERADWAIMVMGLMARRLRRANDVVADLVFADVPTRVARTLIDLADQFGVQDEPADGEIRVAHGLTQTDLAKLVGAARETVNKSLSYFVSRGWIQLETRGLVLLDRPALEVHAR